jgi:hypothetical protein
VEQRSWEPQSVARCLMAGCLGILLCAGACDGGAADDGEEGRGGRDAATGSNVMDDQDASTAEPGGGSGGSGGSSGGGGGTRADASVSGSGDGAVAGGGGSNPIPADCPVLAPNTVPEELSCIGLYADVAAKRVADGVREFAPAHHLWSDGADKQRWIYLPEGTQIDSSVADDWKFPVGTRLFKEFSWRGHRVETRMFWKAGEGRWLKATYHWNEEETAATRFAGGEVDVAGDTYYIPSAKECDQCHKGRDDRSLGFELISLGLPGATGMTLQALIDEDLLSDPPARIDLEIGDDGTGHAADALAWLHVNCGVSCHNDNSSSEGYASNLRLRLPADGLDGRSVADFEAVRTTVGVPAETPRWSDRTRIVAGSPENSLLYFLASTRDPANPKDQMPPIASRRVDLQGLGLLDAWIRSLPAP